MYLKGILIVLASVFTSSPAGRSQSYSSSWSYSNGRSKFSPAERHPSRIELEDDHPFHAAVPGLRVVGGRNARQGEVPWQAALMLRGTSTVFCGATIVGTRVLVTAAHCFDKPREFEVGLDGLNRNRLHQRFEPLKYLIHEDYSRETFQNDIAVVILNGEIELSNSVRLASLPKVYTPKDQTGVISGWGTTKFGGNSPNDLKMTTVETLPQMKCRASYQDFVTITDNMMCAGDKNYAKDACQGDSGGPLVLVTGDEYVLIGVVSFGFECAKEGFPGVYTRVNRYLDFIESSYNEDDLTTTSTTITTMRQADLGKFGRSSSSSIKTLNIFLYICLYILINNV